MNTINAILTSCGRHDLLQKTISSLEDLPYKLNIFIHEDSEWTGLISKIKSSKHTLHWYSHYPRILGQHAAIEYLLNLPAIKSVDYILHLEDDWQFDNSYDWITASLEILEKHKGLVKVLARIDSPHPCELHETISVRQGVMAGNHLRLIGNEISKIPYGVLSPWQGFDNIMWCGFSWNPGITRVSALLEQIPFPKWEQELSERIFENYQTAVIPGVYKHIGEGRSTHE